MSYRLIEGKFVLGYGRADDTRASQPDGDSIWFRANDPEKWKGIGTRAPVLSAGETVQLRLDGIDALELHFRGGHQRLDLAVAARDELIRKIGFREVVYAKNGIAVARAKRRMVPGHVLVRAIDDTPNGRPIVLAYAGKSPARDGATIEPSPSLALQSVNAHLLRVGLAYPMLYDTLPEHVERGFRQLVESARYHALGLWADGIDRTATWTRLGGPTHLALHAIWPKLYRRLAEFMKLGKSLGKLDDWMAVDRDGRDDQMIIGGSTNGRLTDVIEVKDQAIRLRCDPIEIVVKSGATPVIGGGP